MELYPSTPHASLSIATSSSRADDITIAVTGTAFASRAWERRRMYLYPSTPPWPSPPAPPASTTAPAAACGWGRRRQSAVGRRQRGGQGYVLLVLVRGDKVATGRNVVGPLVWVVLLAPCSIRRAESGGDLQDASLGRPNISIFL